MKIISIMLFTLFCLTNTFTQASTWKTINSKQNFTQQDIKNSTQEVIAALNRDYIFPEKSKIIAQELNSKIASNQFNNTNGLADYINKLGLLIRDVSNDHYLDIIETNPLHNIERSNVNGAKQSIENFGFEKIEILSSNIGYLKLNYFYQNPQAELAAARAFDYLSGTSAMIIDLRDVEGTSISLAQYMMSYFVEANSTLIDVQYAKQQKTQTIKSVITAGNGHFKRNYPVYILTSPFVAGTGELFSYTLKHLNKAVIVGKPTMGVALISQKKKVNEFVSIEMPIAIPIHPKTQTNWEQEGVVPDYDVQADYSFDFAYELAKETLDLL
jgi:hypothetical protein